MDLSSLGKGIATTGLLLIVVGGLLWVSVKVGLPLGRLPGDVCIEGDRFSCYAPIVTMIILSVVLTVLLNIIARMLSR